MTALQNTATVLFLQVRRIGVRTPSGDSSWGPIHQQGPPAGFGVVVLILGVTEMDRELDHHLVEIDGDARRLTIYRVRGTTREFYTATMLPDQRWADSAEQIRDFCRQLGENIISDSPQARRVFEL